MKKNCFGDPEFYPWKQERVLRNLSPQLMKFTIARAELESLVKGAGISRPKEGDTFVLSACAARVFVESKDGVAGIEALVLRDGAVRLPAKKFRALLETYKGTKFLNIEGSEEVLVIQNLRMPILSYFADPTPPGEFQVFRPSGPPSASTPPKLRM